jgi:hypothetical protein
MQSDQPLDNLVKIVGSPANLLDATFDDGLPPLLFGLEAQDWFSHARIRNWIGL